MVQVSDITTLKTTEAALRAEIVTREQANALLRESQLALREAQRLGQIGSWEMDIETNAVAMSDVLNRMFERDPASGPSKFADFSRCLQPGAWSRLRALGDRASQAGEPFTFEYHAALPSGAKCWMQARGEPVRDKAGTIVGLRGTTQDITDRKLADQQRDRLIEQLTAANEERSRFAHAASHDLKEPLRMIEAFCGRLRARYSDGLDARGAEYLTLAADAASRMSRMLSDLVDFDRLSPGARGRWFDSRGVTGRALNNLDERIRESGAAIDLGDLPLIHGNATRFERLMQNLIGNALKYVAPGVVPRIAVSAEREGEFWRFRVADNGIGVEPRFHARIFEPFKRLHPRSRYDGSGLGLTMCRRIVEGFGGAIGVRPGEGGGSIFIFTVRAEKRGRRW